MARRKKEPKPASDPGITPAPEEAKPDNVLPMRRAKVGVVKVASRRLVTLRGEEIDLVLQEEPTASMREGYWDGAIVRLDPEGLPELPGRGVEVVLASAKKNLLGAGAAAVKVLPRRASSAVAAPSAEQPPDVTVREVVRGMVQEAGTRDRAALEKLAEEIMAAEGL